MQVRGTVRVAGVVARLYGGEGVAARRPLVELAITDIEGALRFRPASVGFGYQARVLIAPPFHSASSLLLFALTACARREFVRLSHAKDPLPVEGGLQRSFRVKKVANATS